MKRTPRPSRCKWVRLEVKSDQEVWFGQGLPALSAACDPPEVVRRTCDNFVRNAVAGSLIVKRLSPAQCLLDLSAACLVKALRTKSTQSRDGCFTKRQPHMSCDGYALTVSPLSPVDSRQETRLLLADANKQIFTVHQPQYSLCTAYRPAVGCVMSRLL